MISPSEVLRFRSVLETRMGFRFEDAKLEQLREVFERVAPRFSRAPEQFLDQLASPEQGRDLLRAVARELTVTETYFFRGADQLRAFREAVLPARALARRFERKISILSAGCSSGEEAYSLAIIAHEHRALQGYQIEVRGIDLNVAQVERARRARYSTWSLRETSPEDRARWFTPERQEVRLNDDVRSWVSFEEHNLLDENETHLPVETFDVVFCRNVLMYFSKKNAIDVIARLWRALRPAGFFFMGHAETMRGFSDDFHLHHTHGAFYYQKKDGPQAPVFSYTPVARGPSFDWREHLESAAEEMRTMPVPLPVQEDSPPQMPEVVHRFDLSRALELLAEERFTETMVLLDALPAMFEKDPNVLLLRAVLATHGGDLARAQQLGETVLSLDEMNAGAHYVIALCRENAGDKNGAREHHQLAAYIDPEFSMPRLHLGMLARRSGAQEDARRELQKALVLLDDEDVSRIALYGGGFNREALQRLCRAELSMVGGGR